MIIALGPECALLPEEREMITEPLARIMARIDPGTSEIIDKYTDPVVLAVGMGLYLFRVFGILQRRAKEESSQKPLQILREPPSPPAVARDGNMIAPGIPDFVAEALG